MKASIGAGVLILLVVVLVCINACYVHRVTDDLQERLQALPDMPEEGTVGDIQAFKEIFEKRAKLLKITVNYTLIDKVKELTESLLCYAEADMTGDYQTTRALIMDAVEDVGRLEKIWTQD